ncbi:ubiquinone/menaquinone biosynthesis methyltransferase [Pigmentibacter ruber]|uniref:ubiquinone/menaquinone biosynthesis methyltransferase n=1 Tax=Pigmentibacter ruber TaxID=2683196 RepID=UPI00131E49BD|nr:ubiquinone/menaquinone biosynthesis methyltransferase [Pigmentibacter ruber]BFD31591.1 bifunctional demethylmenaquinone methyltransferase/2-methoxy-6-polyprenyl-1,4-benzoquinol methylase UbiE [Pigmentibacter ruber]
MDSNNYNIYRGLHSSLAQIYDVTNDTLTLGLHRIIKKILCTSAIKLAPKNSKLLDLATGTADIILGIAPKRPDLEIIGIDISEAMLEIAEEKIKKKASLYKNNIQLKKATALKIPFPDDTFHTVTICWGMRSLKPYSAALREIYRVLKPGGHLLIVENGKPDYKLFRKIYNSYAHVLPIFGKKIKNLKSSHLLYKTSIDHFPSGSQFVAELFEYGFMKASFKNLGTNIVFFYSAQKPCFK